MPHLRVMLKIISYPVFIDADTGIYQHLGSIAIPRAAESQAWYCDAKCG